MPTIKVEDITSGYGDMEILKRVSLTFRDGKTTCLLGPNGAGKTTLLKTIMNIIPKKNGRVFVDEEDISHKDPRKIAIDYNLSFVPEENNVFPSLSVEENLYMSLQSKNIEEKQEAIGEVYNLFPRLKERFNQDAKTLSGGESKMLALGLGLVTSPKIIIIDELSLGVMPILINKLYKILEELSKERTIVIVDQMARNALGISDYLYVLEDGEIKLEGTPEETKKEKKIVEAYMGVK